MAPKNTKFPQPPPKNLQIPQWVFTLKYKIPPHLLYKNPPKKYNVYDFLGWKTNGGIYVFLLHFLGAILIQS